MYKTKQIGWLIIILTNLVLIGEMILFFALEESEADIKTAVIATVAAFAILQLLFYQLEIVVDQSEIRLSFGIGIIKKTIPLNNVAKTEVVRNKFIYGWGIRLTPHGWMWNIAGYEAVEITYKDNNKKFRIGTKDAAKLKEEIDNRL